MEGNMASLLKGRQRLEATLSSPPLTTKDNVYRMVCDQLSTRLSDNKSVSCASDKTMAQWRFTQVWDLLELLRSASGEENQKWDFTTDGATSAQGWKLKHDTGQMRVMYREGPEGSPFHTLLAEGLIYSPLTSALCLAWEAPSYKYWWPQMNVPTFKIMESRWIKRGHSGEDLSFIRVKAPWPLAAREVLMYAFELEYFDEDLIIVLLHSVPDAPAVEEIMDGLNPLDIPDASPDGVRIELAGGFALQRITADQSYFRTVANIDIKLDIVPPSLINFISRQLIGLGFKLYQKSLTSLSKNEASSEHFKKLLETEPMYAHIKAGLELRDAHKMEENHAVQGMNELDHPAPPKRAAADWDSPKAIESSRVESDGDISNEETSPENGKQVVANAGQTSVIEDCCHNCNLQEIVAGDEPCQYRSSHETIGLDPEVQRALQTLDKMISFVKAHKGCFHTANSLTVTQTQDQRSPGRCNTSSVMVDLHQHELPDFVKEPDVHYPELLAPPRPEKIVSITHVLHGNGETTSVSNTNSLIVKAKRPKVKHSFLCFKISFFCCG